MNEQQTQVLRIMDKYDKLGKQGVIEELQTPLEEHGANLPKWQAYSIGNFLDSPGKTNEETLTNINSWFQEQAEINKILGSVSKSFWNVVSNRLDMLELLEAENNSDGMSKLDELLDRQENKDQTWKNGGRPSNIAFALDDLIEGL